MFQAVERGAPSLWGLPGWLCAEGVVGWGSSGEPLVEAGGTLSPERELMAPSGVEFSRSSPPAELASPSAGLHCSSTHRVCLCNSGLTTKLRPHPKCTHGGISGRRKSSE